MTRRIRDDLLLCAFLGATFQREYDESRADEEPPSWAELAARAGTNKQNFLKLVNGKTVGLGVAMRIASTRFGGSMDSMLQQARMWWDNLEPQKRAELEEWGAIVADRNPLKGEGGKRDSSVPPPRETGQLPRTRRGR